MFNLLNVLELDPSMSRDAQDALLAMLNGARAHIPAIKSSQAGRTLPRDLNGGQMLWRLAFASEQDYRGCLSSNSWRMTTEAFVAQRTTLIDSIAYRVDYADASVGRQREGIWRCLVMSVETHAPPGDIRQLERDLLLMPQYVSSIRNWALGQVVWSQGRRSWTHVWEQEFDDVSGLEGEYMVHPIHWGLVDAWYDPECPQRIVDPFLIHAAVGISQAVIL